VTAVGWSCSLAAGQRSAGGRVSGAGGRLEESDAREFLGGRRADGVRLL
jgi:hypothetical protein